MKWQALIDERYPALRSLLLRYHRVLTKLDLGVVVEHPDLEACSIAEGARTFPLAEYRGVEIRVCDESSAMATGTYKDLDACLITAIARHAGLTQVVVSSGGNLGYALSAYGKRAGMRSVFFHPKSTLYKLDAVNFDWGGVRLVCTDLPERRIKSLALAFARRYGLTHVPDTRWRLAASAVRAMYLLESTMAPEDRVDCIAQTICAGYGPVGIYSCFSELSRKDLLCRSAVPRFLGFQQEANSPMVRAWSEGEREIRAHHVKPRPDEYIEPGLYNVNPEHNYTRLFDLVRYYGGDLRAVSAEDYTSRVGLVLTWFRDAGYEFTQAPGRDGDVLEKTGLLSGVGIVKAIEEGRVRAGERVLFLLTGGFRKVQSRAPPVPDVTIDASRTEDAWVEALGRRFGLIAPKLRRVSDRLVRPPRS
jgi:threonine synthase